MPKYDKCIYLDCDTLVRDDLAKLYDIDLKTEHNYIAAVDDICGNWHVYAVDDDTANYRKNRLQMKNPSKYFNAGMILMNLELMRLCESLYNLWEFVEKNGPFICNDQDVLNMLCVDKDHWLPYEWNFIKSCDSCGLSYMPIEDKSRWLEAEKNPSIVHYTGTLRPWLKLDGDIWFQDEYWTDAITSATFYDCVLIYINKQSMEQVKEFIQQGGVGLRYIIDLTKICLKRKLTLRLKKVIKTLEKG